MVQKVFGGLKDMELLKKKRVIEILIITEYAE